MHAIYVTLKDDAGHKVRITVDARYSPDILEDMTNRAIKAYTMMMGAELEMVGVVVGEEVEEGL